MDLRSKSFVTVEIVLPEDTGATRTTLPQAVRNSGDDIFGHLKVVAGGDFWFEISLSFEGGPNSVNYVYALINT